MSKNKNKKYEPKKDINKVDNIQKNKEKLELDEIIIKDSQRNKFNISKKFIIIMISSLVFLFLLLGIYSLLMVPRISLIGKDYIKIRLDEEYVEKGVIATVAFKSINNDVVVKGNVNNEKIGRYKIEYKVNKGFITRKTYRIVEVVDDIYPIIKLVGDKKKTVCPLGGYIEEGYVAEDNYDGDITKNVMIEQTDTLISYKVKDSSGNETIATREIEKKDLESPKITLNGSSVIYILVGSTYNDPGYNVTDNCDNDLKEKVVIKGSVNTNMPGTYPISYEAVDSGNNKTVVNRNIIVYNKASLIQDASKNGTIYLTFDDGPSATITPKLLKILKEKNVKATFFVINKSSNLDYLIKQEFDEGHTIGLHSYTHRYDLIYQSSDNYFEDLNRINNKVKTLIGIESKIIRFPGGGSNTVSIKYSKGIMTYLTNEVINRGYHYFDWNISSGDAGEAKSSNDVYRNVVNNLSKNQANVVLLHDFENNYKTLNAISDIIDYGINNGYIFSAIDINTPLVTHNVNN